jgi:MFS family permease
MTVPIYITAAILAVIVAYISDRVGKRSPFIISLYCVLIVGFSMYVFLLIFASFMPIKLTCVLPSRCISTSNPKVVYGGVFITACAIYPAFPGVISWLSNNLSGSYKRSAGMAMQIGIGNLGGVSSFLSLGEFQIMLTLGIGHGIQLLPTKRWSSLYPRPRIGAWIHQCWNHCCPRSSLLVHKHQQATRG